jgi:enoyl-CoA hydratase/carnithine racemase
LGLIEGGEVMGELVRLEVEDGVGVIRVDNPRLNAISQQVTRELHACVREIAEPRWSGVVGPSSPQAPM